MANLIMPNRTLDARGLYCPEPIYQTRLAINEIAVGEIIEVFADDPAAEEDFKVWSQRTGQELLVTEKNGLDLRFLIKKMRESK